LWLGSGGTDADGCATGGKAVGAVGTVGGVGNAGDAGAWTLCGGAIPV
jgi:hypothetical protein